MDDEAVAVWVDHEKELVAELARTPAVTQGYVVFEDLKAKAHKLARLAGVLDFAGLWPGLAASITRDAVALQSWDYSPGPFREVAITQSGNPAC